MYNQLQQKGAILPVVVGYPASGGATPKLPSEMGGEKRNVVPFRGREEEKEPPAGLLQLCMDCHEVCFN